MNVYVCALHSGEPWRTKRVCECLLPPAGLILYYCAADLARQKQIIQLHCPSRCVSLKNSPSVLLVLLPEELELLLGGVLLASLSLTEIQSSDWLTHICPVVRNYLCPM